MMISAILLTMAAQAATPTHYVRKPENWPAPIVDTQPPALPPLRKGAVLILSKTNGFRDDAQIKAATQAVSEIARSGKRDVFATENAAVMNPADLARFRVVVLNSISGDVFSPEQRTAFRTWIEAGGGVVLLHGSGGDPRYDWGWYRDALLGTQFIGHTARPEQFQQGSIDIRLPRHPAMAGLPKRWTRTEEWYAFDKVPAGEGTKILATLDEGSYRPPEPQRMGAVHPIVWTRCVGRGRALFSALGHKAETYAEPLHRRLIGNAIRWAAGTRC